MHQICQVFFKKIFFDYQILALQCGFLALKKFFQILDFAVGFYAFCSSLLVFMPFTKAIISLPQNVTFSLFESRALISSNEPLTLFSLLPAFLACMLYMSIGVLLNSSDNSHFNALAKSAALFKCTSEQKDLLSIRLTIDRVNPLFLASKDLLSPSCSLMIFILLYPFFPP